ncbi:hypothetical protein GUITHDRAFT_98480 [Guillardia theta CCMP2712]|uniref:RING-type E3 ubiquitin transferase n=1 Tax=Guillardia theta (strain CCMP2712) TaxID=905079 RepID=L1IAI9_GUITC|nr:hypothetical protein GUITHDRAFT_98480 [Guillardia theta CCMP2712]EKX32919.1 hypothetical protein GUITHDRAFT_98480 [Guillardia theta CCMP2712]|eukprot:XP_005819899.1 hypothetical protein GUITHDRAFT_98480 [Guillardia theta CCMP2712]
MGTNSSRPGEGGGNQGGQGAGDTGMAGNPSQMGYGGTRFAGGSTGLFAPRPDGSLFVPNSQRQVPPAPQLQLTETIRNDVNLKKQTLKLNKCANSPNTYCLEFLFDAAADCTVSIWFLAEEQVDSANNTIKFETSYEIQPKTVKFKAALGQHFTQPENEGFNVSLVQNRGQMYYHHGSQHFPIVIMLQTCDENAHRVQSQSTFATFKSNADGSLSVAVIKQKIQVKGNAYELQEIYGIEQNDAENSKECVICMSAPKDTTVLPCRHMCMCSDCAKVLRYQTNKCPICRCSVESLLQIKVNSSGETAPVGNS